MSAPPGMPPPSAAARALLALTLGLCLLGAGCATPPPARQFDFFRPSQPASDPWFEMVSDWQERARRDEHVSVEGARGMRAARLSGVLRRKMGAFEAEERLALARKINLWTRLEGRKHYRFDGNDEAEDDHWPTFAELVEANGDDCDGLDLIAYQLLIEFGFPRDRIYRAVIRRDRDRANHMVTLWFEDPQDPWVFDATGAISYELLRMSEIQGWTPTTMFNERHRYSVGEVDAGRVVQLDR